MHRGQTKFLARHLACIVSWLAGATNLGSSSVDCTQGRTTDVADQGGATISIAAHAPVLIVDEFARNARDVGVGLSREPWPLAWVWAAGSASPARRCPRHRPRVWWI